MANYLMVWADAPRKSVVSAWFARFNASPADLLKIPLSQGGAFYYLARQGHLDKTPDGGVFKGYAIDHERREMIYSGECARAPDVHKPTEGCYLRLQRDHGGFIVGNDIFAQLPLLYFQAEGVIALSDSVFVLCELRRQLGLPVRVHQDAALSRAWVHGMASHPLGTSTLIDQIDFAPPGTKFCINTQNTLELLIERQRAPELFSADLDDYRAVILRGAQRAADLVATVRQVPEAYSELSLSGGLDSRACLAAIFASDDKDAFYIRTNQSSKDDYAVAKQLSRKFGFEFREPPRRSAQPRDPVQSWFLSCAGLYDPLAVGRSVPQDLHVRITGVGAEAYKGYFGWRPLSQIRPSNVGYVSAVRPAIARFKQSGEYQSNLRMLGHVPRRRPVERLKAIFGSVPKADRDICDAAYREACGGLLKVGVAADDPWASEWHFLCYMNSIHSGRANADSLLTLSPLLQHELVAMSRSTLNAYPAPAQGAPSIATDLMIALSPELAAMPFDEPKKNLPAEYVAERSNYLGKISRAEPYAIVGDPKKTRIGTPQMFGRLIENRGLSGKLEPEMLRKLAAQGFESIPPEIKHAYLIPQYLVDHDLPDRVSVTSWQCKAAGKLMAFLLVAWPPP